MASADPFDYHSEYRVLICRQCRIGVPPASVSRHLRGRGHHYTSEEVREVRRAIGCLSPPPASPSAVQVPSAVQMAVDNLELHDDGLKCLFEPSSCQYICRSVDGIRHHLRTEHQASRHSRRGRPVLNKESERGGGKDDTPLGLWKRITCQQIFASRKGSQYFEILQAGENGSPSTDTGDNNMTDSWTRLGAAMDASVAQIAERERQLITSEQAGEPNPWLRRTGWLAYLAGQDRLQLVAAVQAPQSPEEPQLTLIWEGMADMIHHCQRTAAFSPEVGHFIRMEVMRTQATQTRYTPLQPHIDPKILADYAHLWQQLVIFLARTQLPHDWSSPSYTLTRSQRRAWHILARLTTPRLPRRVHSGLFLSPDTTDSDEQNNEFDASDTDSSSCSDCPQDGSESPCPRLHGVPKACLRFCMSLLNHRVEAHEYDSPLICALAVLGIRSETGWQGPNYYPPLLSKIIKIARFMVIESALTQARQRRDLREPSQESDSSDGSALLGLSPPPSRNGCLIILQHMMDRFMVRGCQSPLQWMLDLRAYGLKIDFETTRAGHVDWVDDQILYKDIAFTMPLFRFMIHQLITTARGHLLVELMFDPSPESLPLIPWTELRDDVVNNEVGWSCLQDPRSPWPVEGDHWLFERIQHDDRLRRSFLQGERLSEAAVKDWTHHITRFRELLLVLVHFTAGQPARAPELLSLRYRNTPNGQHRNIFLEDGLVVLVTRYHKGYAVSGSTKVIQRYLPREVGELLIWYLWLVLPFQQRLEAQYWHREELSAYLWPPDPTDRPWSSERMRKLLQRETLQHLGHSIGIQAYRNLAIAISRRFLGSGQYQFEADEEDKDRGPGEDDINELEPEEDRWDGILDQQAGHNSHVAGMVYARGIMERVGEVASKRAWFRRASTAWHEWLGLQSAQGRIKRPSSLSWEQDMAEAEMARRKRLRRVDPESALQRMLGFGASFRGVQKPALEAILRGESQLLVVMPTGAGKSLLFMLPAFCAGDGVTVVVVPLIALRQDMVRRCQSLGISYLEWRPNRPETRASIVLVVPETAGHSDFRTFLNRLKALQRLDRIVIDEAHLLIQESQSYRPAIAKLQELVEVATQVILLTATLPPPLEGILYDSFCWQSQAVQCFRMATSRGNLEYRVEFAADESMQLRKARERIKERPGRVLLYANAVARVQQLAAELEWPAYYSAASDKESLWSAFCQRPSARLVTTSALGMGVDVPDIRCILHLDIPRTLIDYAQESGRAGRDLQPALICLLLTTKQYQNWSQDLAAAGAEDRAHIRKYIRGDPTAGRVCRRIVLDEYLDGRRDRAGCEPGEVPCDVCTQQARSAATQTPQSLSEGLGVGGSRGSGGFEASQSQRTQSESSGREVRQRVERTGSEDRILERQDQQRLAVPERRRINLQGEVQTQHWLLEQLERFRGSCVFCRLRHQPNLEHPTYMCADPDSGKLWQSYQQERAAMRHGRHLAPFAGCVRCFMPQDWCDAWWPGPEGSQRRYEYHKDTPCQFDEVLMPIWIGLLHFSPDYTAALERRLQGTEVDIRATEGFSLATKLRWLGQRSDWGGIQASQLLREVQQGLTLWAAAPPS